MTPTSLNECAGELIRGRRTINVFKPSAPPRELIVEALDAARWAPNHHLTDPWRFYLLGQETARAVAELNAELVAARGGPEAAQAKLDEWRAKPGWLVVTCLNSTDSQRAREDYAACCCAIQNLMLYLWSAGVGSKWSTGAVTRDPRFYDLIWVDPEVETVVSLMSYGYPADIPQTPRKPLAELLIELP